MTAGKTAKECFNMKNTKSFLGLAALWLAIIALALTGCPIDGDSSDDNNNGGNPTTPGEGEQPTDPTDPVNTTDSVTIAELAGYLDSLSANTAATPHTVILDSTVTIDTIDTADASANGVWATINSTVQTAGKYVILDLAACTTTDNTIYGRDTPTNNHFNIIKDNGYIKGITLPSTLTSIGGRLTMRGEVG
jgi:ABC-type oligopeptide transport system substrate-binding subunit